MALAFITGSSSGIGRATALALAAAGWDLYLHGNRNLNGLSETACQVRQAADCTVRCCTADLSCPKACRSIVQAAFNCPEPPSAWINLAGADVLTGQAANLSFDDKLERLLHVDVLGTIRLCRLVADHWSNQVSDSAGLLQKPCIINVGWDQAKLGMEGEPGQMFGTTKAAIEAFTHSLALSVGPDIRVNCVAPGWIQTNWGENDASDAWVHRATSESLLNRWGRAGDVASAIRWLVSPEAEFVNGQTLNVNGGRRYFTGNA